MFHTGLEFRIVEIKQVKALYVGLSVRIRMPILKTSQKNKRLWLYLDLGPQI